MTENKASIEKKVQYQIRRPFLLFLISLIVMLIFDQLVWKRQFGIQFFVIVLSILLGLFILVKVERQTIPWRSYLLLVPILLGAIMTVFLKTISTSFFNIVLALYTLAFLTFSLLNGEWMRYRLRDVALGFMRLIQSALVDPIMVFVWRKRAQKERPSGKNTGWRKIRPFLLGLLIALPLLLIFGALLASADIIFKTHMAVFINLFTVDNIIDLTIRLFYIILLGYFLAGAYVHGLTRTTKESNGISEKPLVQPFLGHIEALTVLGLVNLLFMSFIIIQFRYFFAGQANISIEGFTYAEYARRGFFELVAVAVISLGVYYLLSLFTKRANPIISGVFSALGILFMLQVGCILFSAFQRLCLYETAYGFTTLRTLTHIFMVWIGVLIIAFTLMEVFKEFRRLALVLFLVFFGFVLTLNLLNVDRFIAKRNIALALAGKPLDASYLLNNLSDDSIPTLFDAQQTPDTPLELQKALTGILACKMAIRDYEGKQALTWPEWHFARVRADRLFEAHRDSLEEHALSLHSETNIYEQNGQRYEETYAYYTFEVDGEEIYCMPAD